MIRFLKGCLLIQDINKIISQENKDIIDNLIDNGATVYLVGGAIRNYYLKYPVNDFDLEVYNIDFDELVKLVDNNKIYVNYTFKTIKINNIEIALPRTETKVGLNYTEYQLSFNNIKPITAIERRDFTINSLMYNLNENKLYDFCGGEKDLTNHLLKATNYDKFQEDSIRILRLLKYQSKYDLTIDEKTYALAKQISNQLWQQPCTMVAKFLNGIIVNEYFNRDIFFDILSDFFIVDELKNWDHNNEFHPERTLYNHIVCSLICLDMMKINNERDYQLLFWTLFFHDYGKLYDRVGHAKHSKPYFEKYQDFVLTKEKDKKLVMELISDHMVFRNYAVKKDFENMKALKKKYGSQFYLLEILGTCDYAGRVVGFDKSKLKSRVEKFKETIIKKYEQL